MSLNYFYQERIDKLRADLFFLTRKESSLAFLRLFSFVGSMILFFIVLKISIILSVLLLIAGLTAFGIILKFHLKAMEDKQNKSFLIAINEKELASLNGNFQNFPDGQEFLQKDHAYAGDLDVFGKSSLFQFLNRTTTHPGAARLADWLSRPASRDEILRRQQAINELKEQTDWRQQLMSVGYSHAGSMDNPGPVLEWINEKPLLLSKRYLLISVNILSLLSVGSLIGYFLSLPLAFFGFLIGVNFLVSFGFTKKVNQVHGKLSQTAAMLNSYHSLIKLIENKKFTSKKLLNLQQEFFSNSEKASTRIEQVFNLVKKLDYRLNIIISVFLNLFYFWDIRQVINLEKWKAVNREEIEKWFSAMSEFEALISISNAYHNNPSWIFPEIILEQFHLNAEEMGHPLILPDNRVCNNLTVDGKGNITIITGSNMSGKSTFLRTCGINIVLAMAGSPVCAKNFRVSHVLVYTSMRIVDSLEENTSSFYAELKRLAGIIRMVERNEPVFLLLDEILRGTNSHDRHIGSVALIRQLLKYRANAIIATHDLALSGLEEEMPDLIDNYNFDVKIDGDELYFDYKLNRGTCKSLNASLLMRKMGIEI